MKDKTLGIDVKLPTPEQFTQELIKDKPNPELAMACIEEYSRIYHQCAMYVMSGEHEKAQKLRERYLPQ